MRQIVADIPDGIQGLPGKERLENARHRVGDHVAIRHGKVRRRPHGPHVPLPLLRRHRHAAELAVGDVDAVMSHGPAHDLQRVVAHLVPQPPAAAVNHHRHTSGNEPQAGGVLFSVDLVHHLDLHEMISRSQGTQLGPAPVFGPLRHLSGKGSLETSPLFGVLSIALGAKTVLHGPRHPAFQHLVKVLGRKGLTSSGDRPRRHGGKKGGKELVHHPAEVFCRDGGREEAHAAGDVVPHAPGTDDPLFRVEGGDPADGKAVPPVDVRHGEAVSHDAGKGGHVGHLQDGVVVLQQGGDVLVGEDHAGNAHAGHRPRMEQEAGAVDPFQKLFHADIPPVTDPDIAAGRGGESSPAPCPRTSPPSPRCAPPAKEREVPRRRGRGDGASR